MIFPITQINNLLSQNDEPLEGIVSIYGDFGVGKTTFSLQTAINAANLKKKVVYIYTKPNFPIEKISNQINKDKSESATEDSINPIDEIIFIQTTDFNDLNTIVFNLEFMVLNNLKENDNLLNLIVIDSITDLYRLELDREKKVKNVSLNYQLNQIMANLFYINETYSIEVLVANELSKKNQDGQTVEVQSGGKVMDYWIQYAIKINRTEKLNERKFVLTKHPNNKSLDLTAELSNKGFK